MRFSQTKNKYTRSHSCPKIRAKSKFDSRDALHLAPSLPSSSRGNFARRQTSRYFGHRADFCHLATDPPSQLAVSPRSVLPLCTTCNGVSQMDTRGSEHFIFVRLYAFVDRRAALFIPNLTDIRERDLPAFLHTTETKTNVHYASVLVPNIDICM